MIRLLCVWKLSWGQIPKVIKPRKTLGVQSASGVMDTMPSFFQLRHNTWSGTSIAPTAPAALGVFVGRLTPQALVFDSFAARDRCLVLRSCSRQASTQHHAEDIWSIIEPGRTRLCNGTKNPVEPEIFKRPCSRSWTDSWNAATSYAGREA